MIGGIDENSIRGLADFRNAEWNEHFKCSYVRIRNRTISLYKSGKYVIFGIKDLSEAERLTDGLKGMLSSLGSAPDILSMDVMRVSLNDTIGRQIDHDKAAECLDKAVYEPEITNALILKNEETTVLLNSSGTVLVNSTQITTA